MLRRALARPASRPAAAAAAAMSRSTSRTASALRSLSTTAAHGPLAVPRALALPRTVTILTGASAATLDSAAALRTSTASRHWVRAFSSSSSAANTGPSSSTNASASAFPTSSGAGAGASAAFTAPSAAAASPAVDAALSAADYTLDALLNPAQKAVLGEIRALLDAVPAVLSPLGLSAEDAELLAAARDSLSELFLVVVVGEFNSGKSNFINALLGARHCRTGILPTTEKVQILKYGPTPTVIAANSSSTGAHATANADAAASSSASASANTSATASASTSVRRNDGSIQTVLLPVDWLKQAHLVDTPGTNAVLREHQEITERFIPSADLILFVTSVERPFSESEKQFMSKIAQWRKKVVIVLNKVDLVVPTLASTGLISNSNLNNNSNSGHGHRHDESIASRAEHTMQHFDSSVPHVYADGSSDAGTSFDEVRAFVASNAKVVLKEVPPVFGVSSRLALDGKLALAASSPQSPSSSSAGANSRVPHMSAASAAAAQAAARALIVNSGFSELERHVLSELADERKVALKLSNPLSVADTVIRRYDHVLAARRRTLATDVETRSLLQAETRDFRKEALIDLEAQLAKLDNVFLRMRRDSTAFLNKHVRVVNMPSLLLGSKQLRESYDKAVNAGVSAEVDAILATMSAWLVHKGARQAQALAHIMQRSVSATAGSGSNNNNAPAPAAPAAPAPVAVPAAAAATDAAAATAASTAPATAPATVSEKAASDNAAAAASAAVSAAAAAATMTGPLDLSRQVDLVRAAGVDLHHSRAEVLASIQAACRDTVAEAKRQVR